MARSCYPSLVSSPSNPLSNKRIDVGPGAMHWGMEIAGYGGHKGYPRLVLGSAPMVLAWTTLGMDPMTALAAQWAGFSAVWYLDSKVTMAGWSKIGRAHV